MEEDEGAVDNERKCVACLTPLPPEQNKASNGEKSVLQEFCNVILPAGTCEEFERVFGNEIGATCEVCEQKIASVLRRNKIVMEGRELIMKLSKSLGQKIKDLEANENMMLENLEAIRLPEALGLKEAVSVSDSVIVFQKGITRAKEKLKGRKIRDTLTAAAVAVNNLSRAFSTTTSRNNTEMSSLQEEPINRSGSLIAGSEIESNGGCQAKAKPPSMDCGDSDDENISIGQDFQYKTEVPPEEDDNELEMDSNQEDSSMSQPIVDDVVKVELPEDSPEEDKNRRGKKKLAEDISEDRRDYNEHGIEVVRTLRSRTIHGPHMKGFNLTSMRIRAANKNPSHSNTTAKKSNEDSHAEVFDIASDSEDDAGDLMDKDKQGFNQENLEESKAVVTGEEEKSKYSEFATSQQNLESTQVPENIGSDEEALNSSVSLLSQGDIQVQNGDGLPVASEDGPTNSAQIPHASNEDKCEESREESATLLSLSPPSSHSVALESSTPPPISNAGSIGTVGKKEKKLNTKGCCFLCLKTVHCSRTMLGKKTTIQCRNEKPIGLKCVLRHLKIELPQSCTASPYQDNTEDPPHKNEDDVEVDLCQSCEGIVNNYSKSFESLEKAQMELNYWSGRVHQQISEGSKQPEQVQYYSKRMTSDAEGLAQLVFVNDLRKEIARKSLSTRVGLEARIFLPKLKWTPKNQDLDYIEDSQDQVSSPSSELDCTNEEVVDSSEEDRSRNSLSVTIYDDDSEMVTTINEEKLDISPPSDHDPSPEPSLPPSDAQTEIKLAPKTFAQMIVKNQKTGSYSCTSCNKQIKTKWAAKRHYDAIHLGKRYTCKVCGTQFTQLSSLATHKNSCNGKKRKSYSLSTIKKWHFDSQTRKFVCAVCSKEFVSRTGAYHHYEAVHLKKKHKCEICKMAVFNQVSNLTSHLMNCKATLKKRLSQKLRRETDPKFRFPCPTCGKKFERKADMERHFRIVHLKERNYACDICEKKFLTKQHLVGHKEVAHLGRKFNCKICHREYRSRRGREVHENQCAKNEIKTGEVGDY